MIKKILLLFLFLTLIINNADAYNPIGDPLNTAKLVNKKAISCNSQSSDIQKLGLDDVINLALCNNPRTKQSLNNLLSNQAEVGIAYSDYWPKISASSSYNNFYNHTKMTAATDSNDNTLNGSTQYLTNSLALNYLIYDFGRRNANLESVKQALFASNYNYNSELSETIFNAIKKYYNYFSFKEDLIAKQENYDLAKTNFDYSNKRKDAGLAKKLDVLQAKSNLSLANLDLLQAKQDVELARVDLILFIGLSPAAKIEITKQALEESQKQFENSEQNIEELINIATAQNPTLKKAEAEYKLSKANLNKIKSEAYPKLTLGASISKDRALASNSLNSSNHLINLTLSIPLFSGFSDFYASTSARYNVEESTAKFEQTKREIILQSWQSYNRLQIATENLTLTQDLLNAAIESQKQAEEGYKLGANDIRDVISTGATLLDAKQKNISAKYQFYIAKIDLLKVIGGL